MGTSEPGEIAELARIARPTIGVVTTVSEAHTERLGDLRGVLAEKLDLVRALGPADTAVVGDEPEELAGEARALRPDVAVSGRTPGADRALRPVGEYGNEDGTYGFSWRGYPVRAPCPGDAQREQRVAGACRGPRAQGSPRAGPPRASRQCGRAPCAERSASWAG